MEQETPEARIRILAKHIIYVRELEKPEPGDILHSAQETSRLGKDWDHFGIVVEFTSFVVPSSEVRHSVSRELASIKKKLIGVAVVTETNILLQVGFKFIARFAGFPTITFHKTREAAAKHIEVLSKRHRKEVTVSECDKEARG
jgi:hypothetical protein